MVLPMQRDLDSMHEKSDIWKSHLNGNQIRLVHINPAENSTDPINCSLEIFALDQITVRFDAISYTWGIEQPDVSISCDGRRLVVTKSCNDALRALRSRGGRVAWIDQLCINQEDLEERSAQILLMGQIYSRAEQVYIWLGEFGSARQPGSLWRHIDSFPQELLKAAFTECVDKFDHAPPSDMQDYEAVSVLKQLLTIVPRTPEQQALLAGHGLFFHLVLNLLERPYHGRRWIIQEISLNRAVSVLLGDLCFPFETLIQLAFIMRPIFSLIDHKRVRHGLTRRLGQTLIDRFRNGRIPWLHMTNIDMIGRIRRSIHDGKQLDLIELMVQCSMFQVRDAVDDLYAIRALTSHATATAAPAPDYTASVEKVYLDHTEWLFSQGQGLRALSKLPLVFENNRDLPTWTIDFRTGFDLRTGETSMGDRVAYRDEIFWEYLSESRTPGLHSSGLSSGSDEDLASFQASLPRGAATLATPAADPVISDRKLYIDGYVLGTISDLMPPDKARSMRGIVDAHRWYQSIPRSKQTNEVSKRIESQKTSIESFRYGSHNDNCTAFREKILFNLACNQKPPVAIHGGEAMQMPDEPDNELAAEFITEYDEENDKMEMTLLGSVRFGCTTQGFPVLVPVRARQGDLVVFFPGVSKPFLLRESSAADEYSIVGQMHVLTLMWWDESVFELAAFREMRRMLLV